MKRVLVFLVVFGGVLCGCMQPNQAEPSGEASGSVTRLPEADGRDLPELGEPLLISLALAKTHHHKADVYLRRGEGEGDLDSAIAAVRQVLAIEFPEGAAEAEDVKLDARARLAKLLIARGKLDEAMTVVDEGIARATRRSFFLANLYTVKGEVYEARANLLDDAGADDPEGDDPEGDDPEAAAAAKARAGDRAKAARRSAIIAFDESIRINTELQRALMSEDR